jgi:hypothetical protein
VKVFFIKKKKRIELKIPKLFLTEILKNEKYKNYLKIFMVKEFQNENLIFFEEVSLYQNMPKIDRLKRSKMIFNTFFTEGSNYELNITKKEKEEIIQKLDYSPIDLFDNVLHKNIFVSIINSYSNFLVSDLYKEMFLSNKSFIEN